MKKTGLYIFLPLLLFISLFMSIPYAASIFTSTSLGYTIELPEGWTVFHDKPNRDIFYDQTSQYGSYCAIEVHKRDTLAFPAADLWTRTHFDGYLVTARYGVNPWGAVLMYDSSVSATLGSIWAPEIYARFFAADSVTTTWEEYVIYACTGLTGYELYAIGDTSDMKANLALYATILRSAHLSGAQLDIQIRPVRESKLRTTNNSEQITVDCIGRVLTRFSALQRISRAAGLVIQPGKSHIVIDR